VQTNTLAFKPVLSLRRQASKRPDAVNS